MLSIHSQELPNNNDVNILIVDDEDMVLEVMSNYIVSFGFNSFTASDGKEAIDLLKKHTFNIVLTDINMPEMNGIELLHYVTEHYPDTGVIVVTGISEDYSYVDVINAGAIDYMTKPFEGSELLAKLKRVIREQAMVFKLQEMSIRDSLTNLYNRRYFDFKIQEEISRAVRQSYQVFISFIDVDNFKAYNDSYGHQAGDNLLVAVGQTIQNCARSKVDFSFRYGGDEFAVIITQTTREQALLVSERIISSFMQFEFGKTSLSCGLAQFTRNKDLEWQVDIDNFIAKIDQALYTAKDRGRGQVFVLD